ncbi:MAG: hypothetical protein JRI68_04410 [Deltaproteobacteria bacterium]|nr:hypothetical protein [Deltaproteobacteria bacterium]
MGANPPGLGGVLLLMLMAPACGAEPRQRVTVVDVPAIALTAAAPRHERCQTVETAPPAVLRLRWPGRATDINPRVEDRALALFVDDAYNYALTCPRVARPAEPNGDFHLCPLQPTASLRIGPATVWVAVSRYSHEWDGMYGFEDEVVLALPGTPQARPIHTLTQWNQDVVDCASQLTMRRQRVVDLDADGCSELCIETVEPWRPVSRRRHITAWRFEPSRSQLVQVPALDGECPRVGYSFFVWRKDYGDALTDRARVQGDDDGLAPCPDLPPEVCFDRRMCSGS